MAVVEEAVINKLSPEAEMALARAAERYMTTAASIINREIKGDRNVVAQMRVSVPVQYLLHAILTAESERVAADPDGADLMDHFMNVLTGVASAGALRLDRFEDMRAFATEVYMKAFTTVTETNALMLGDEGGNC